MVAAVTPSLTAELFTLHLAGGRYLVYAPLRRAAFIGNARAVNVLADLQAGRHDAGADPGEAYVESLQGMELLEAGPERPPLTLYEGTPAPTTVTLFTDYCLQPVLHQLPPHAALDLAADDRTVGQRHPIPLVYA